MNRVADRCARYLCETTATDFAAHHEVRIDHVYETLYVLICGLIMFVRASRRTGVHREGHHRQHPAHRGLHR
ncbi:MAG: hypothetical protein ACLTSX_12710 [Collinsella sp.]